MIDTVDTKKLRMFVQLLRRDRCAELLHALRHTIAVSHGIKSLEEGLNTKLIDRSEYDPPN